MGKDYSCQGKCKHSGSLCDVCDDEEYFDFNAQ